MQIAKAMGAEVTGVCSTRNVELVRSIGADHVIDYTVEDFTRTGPRYDLIFDNVGAHSLSATRRALTPSGPLLSNGAPVGGWVGGLGHFMRAALASIVVRQQGRPFVSMPKRETSRRCSRWSTAGQVRPVIDHTRTARGDRGGHRARRERAQPGHDGHHDAGVDVMTTLIAILAW